MDYNEEFEVAKGDILFIDGLAIDIPNPGVKKRNKVYREWLPIVIEVTNVGQYYFKGVILDCAQIFFVRDLTEKQFAYRATKWDVLDGEMAYRI